MSNQNSAASIPILSDEELFHRMLAKKYPAQTSYLSMYSSWLGGITTRPALMAVPIDDHMVHRGDGVFEAIKVKNKKVWLEKEHLDRLQSSAARIGLKLPVTLDFLRNIILQCILVTGRSEGLIRIFLSRGPGQFSTNPYDSVSEQLYVVFTELKMPQADLYEKGVRIGKSEVPLKPSWYPQVKSCNYLPNVLMKKEAVDRKLDFTVSFNEDGLLAESSTENIILVNRKDELCSPSYDLILKGTTMSRLFDLVESKKRLVVRRSVELREEDLLTAKEVMMVGTTLDVLPVQSYESHSYHQRSYAKEFLQLLREDQT